MTPASHSQVQSRQSDPDLITRAGGWLFRHRSSIPAPLALAVVILPAGAAPVSIALIASGVALTVLGESLRLWAVHHIGVISRTRSDRLGPLVAAGPFAFVRNPLYLGNIALWAGFAIAAQLAWLAPIFVVLLGLEYHAIVRWEERLLEERLGDAYREYAARVPRWVPTFNRGTETIESGISSASSSSSAVNPAKFDPFSWSDTLFSERGTLLAIAVGYAFLFVKARS
jgi:protein-S-isoprenylcysteine O-methyltransferase Ste14